MHEQQLITLDEACFRLRCGELAVKRMIQTGKLVALQIPTSKRAKAWQRYRIFWPPQPILDYLEAELHPLMSAPLLSVLEVAEITGLTPSSVRTYIHFDIIKAVRMGKYSYVTPMEVRRYLYVIERAKRRKAGTKSIKIERMVRWFKAKYLREETGDEALEEVLDGILGLPEPERTTQLMQLFERVDKMAEAISFSALRQAPASNTDTCQP